MSVPAFDIRAYLDFLQVPYWEAGTNVSKGWIGVQCVFCDDHHNHMGVHTYFKNFSCWKCQAKGSLIELIIALEDVGYGAALARIDDFQTDDPLEPEERHRAERDGGSVLPLGCSPKLTNSQRQWLRMRRYDPDQIQERWGVLAGPPTGKWAHRLICPFTYQGEVVTWVGADPTGAKSAKYKAAPVEESFIPVSELLYGLDHVVPGGPVLVVEGMLDAWRIGYGALAIMGIGVGDHKVSALAALNASSYFIMFDGEPQATRNAHTLGNTLRHTTGRPVEVLELDEGDPDDLTDEAALEIREIIGLD